MFGEFICVLVIVSISQRALTQFRILREERYFMQVLLAAIIVFIADIISMIVNGKMLPGFKILNIISCGVYLFELCYLGIMWCIYVDYKLNRQTQERFKKRIITYTLPYVIMLVLALISQKTHIIYYIDTHNCYRLGNYYIIHVIFTMLYSFIAVYMALRSAIREKNKRLRKEKLTIALFSAVAFVFGMLQIYFSDISFTAVGITATLLLVYINVQTKQVFADSLTGINNRRQFNIIIDSIFESKTSKNFYLLIMDVDRFKQINDVYGHLEGDAALVKIAEILTAVCNKNDDFLARYGGDEFVIITKRKTDAEIELLKREIQLLVDSENLYSDKEYDLSLSIGSTKIDFKTDTADTVIRKADEQLYLIKQQKQERVNDN